MLIPNMQIKTSQYS